jgi:predicted negative regulator of RcsB-dependent stress response
VADVSWATPRALVVAVVLSMAAQLIGTGLFVYTSWQARQQNCEQVQRAFDNYTSALAQISHADPETVQAFRDAYEPELEQCA